MLITSNSMRKEWREKLKIAGRKAWRNGKTRKKFIRAVRNFSKTPEYREKVDIAVTKWWQEHPHIKKEYSRKLKNFFIKHPQAFAKKFENSKNNPFSPHIKTKLGEVRSQGEKAIADYLASNNIKAYYEAKPLLLDGHICVPDFYLPKIKTYIEYYGGYPGSWKKKVLKNFFIRNITSELSQ